MVLSSINFLMNDKIRQMGNTQSIIDYVLEPLRKPRRWYFLRWLSYWGSLIGGIIGILTLGFCDAYIINQWFDRWFIDD